MVAALALAALAAWVSAVVAAIRAWRAGYGGAWVIWNGMRFLMGTDAPPAARLHLHRLRLSMGAFFACVLGLALASALTRSG